MELWVFELIRQGQVVHPLCNAVHLCERSLLEGGVLHSHSVRYQFQKDLSLPAQRIANAVDRCCEP